MNIQITRFLFNIVCMLSTAVLCVGCNSEIPSTTELELRSEVTPKPVKKGPTVNPEPSAAHGTNQPRQTGAAENEEQYFPIPVRFGETFFASPFFISLDVKEVEKPLAQLVDSDPSGPWELISASISALRDNDKASYERLLTPSSKSSKLDHFRLWKSLISSDVDADPMVAESVSLGPVVYVQLEWESKFAHFLIQNEDGNQKLAPALMLDPVVQLLNRIYGARHQNSKRFARVNGATLCSVVTVQLPYADNAVYEFGWKDFACGAEANAGDKKSQSAVNRYTEFWELIAAEKFETAVKHCNHELAMKLERLFSDSKNRDEYVDRATKVKPVVDSVIHNGPVAYLFVSFRDAQDNVMYRRIHIMFENTSGVFEVARLDHQDAITDTLNQDSVARVLREQCLDN